MTQATEGQPRWEVRVVQRVLEDGGKIWAWALIPGWGVCAAPGGLRVFTPDGASHLLVDGGSSASFRELCARWSADAHRWLDEQAVQQQRATLQGLGGSWMPASNGRDSFESAKLTTGEFNEP